MARTWSYRKIGANTPEPIRTGIAPAVIAFIFLTVLILGSVLAGSTYIMTHPLKEMQSAPSAPIVKANTSAYNKVGD